jgi:hypothetical protein
MIRPTSRKSRWAERSESHRGHQSVGLASLFPRTFTADRGMPTSSDRPRSATK